MVLPVYIDLTLNFLLFYSYTENWLFKGLLPKATLNQSVFIGIAGNSELICQVSAMILLKL